MRVLVTGITGFVGNHLAAELVSHDPSVELWGTGWGEIDRSALEASAPSLRYVEADLVGPDSIVPILEEARPDVIFHLAAASSVARSWDSAARSLAINAGGTANLFDAVRRTGLAPVIVVSSTAEIYGRVDPSDGPVDEQARLAPVSPYGTSKTAQDLLSEQFHSGRGLSAVRVRFFHLTGPGRPPHFVASSFARQIAQAEFGLAPAKLSVGNLDSVRDFTDVRDAVRACRLVADPRFAGEAFNVCSGRATRIRQIVDLLLERSRVPISIEPDPDRYRQADIPWLVGDPSKIEAAVGWRAEIPLQQTLSDLLEWWRIKLRV
jgi:GDP-4-dehydro-6-deoxy-D-mannose reductase